MAPFPIHLAPPWRVQVCICKSWNSLFAQMLCPGLSKTVRKNAVQILAEEMNQRDPKNGHKKRIKNNYLTLRCEHKILHDFFYMILYILNILQHKINVIAIIITSEKKHTY